MRTHSEERHLPYDPDLLYSIIADVDRYADFLPWCVASRVRERHGNVMVADLSIGYRGLRESFTSHVELAAEEGKIRTTQKSGPFRHLESLWTIRPDDGEGAVVDFSIAFEFRSMLLDKLMGAVFERATERMVQAFEDRAAALQR